LRDEGFHVTVTSGALLRKPGEICILCRQGAQKGPDQIHVSVREMELRVVLVEKQGMARLAVGIETDSLIKTSGRLGLVAVGAVQLPAFHRRNIGGEMALVIEAKDIGIADLLLDELELRVRSLERRKDFRITAPGPRRFHNHLLRRVGAEMEQGW